MLYYCLIHSSSGTWLRKKIDYGIIFKFYKNTNFKYYFFLYCIKNNLNVML